MSNCFPFDRNKKEGTLRLFVQREGSEFLHFIFAILSFSWLKDVISLNKRRSKLCQEQMICLHIQPILIEQKH